MRVLNYRHFWTAGIALLAALFAITVAMASTWSSTTLSGKPDQWASYYVNYYGYGDYTYVTTMPVNGYNYDWDNYLNPVATPKSYSIKGGGTITIPSGIHGEVLDWLLNLSGSVSGEMYVTAHSDVDTEYLGLGASSNLKNPWSHIFLQSQSEFICPNESYEADVAYNTFADVAGRGIGPATAVSEINVFYCPEGGMPQFAQAQFWHGIW